MLGCKLQILVLWLAAVLTQAPNAYAQSSPSADHPQRLEQIAQRYATGVQAPTSATRFDESRPLGTPAQPFSISDHAAGGTSGGSSWILNTVTALGAVVGLILVGRAALVRLTGRTPATTHSPAVQVISRVALAPRQHVLLLRLGHRLLVVGDSGSTLSTLANIDDPDEVATMLKAVAAAQPHSISRGFRHLLNRCNGDYARHDIASEEGLDLAEHRTDRARDEVSGLLARLRALSRGGGA